MREVSIRYFRKIERKRLSKSLLERVLPDTSLKEGELDAWMRGVRCVDEWEVLCRDPEAWKNLVHSETMTSLAWLKHRMLLRKNTWKNKKWHSEVWISPESRSEPLTDFKQGHDVMGFWFRTVSLEAVWRLDWTEMRLKTAWLIRKWMFSLRKKKKKLVAITKVMPTKRGKGNKEEKYIGVEVIPFPFENSAL